VRIAQICADRGIAPGSTKGAAQHLRGIAAGLSELGNTVTTYAARRCESEFPVEVRPIERFDTQAAQSFDVVYERYSLGHRHGLEIAREAGRPFVLEVNAPLVAEATAHRPATVSSEDRETEAHLLYEADLVITVSGGLSAWVANHRDGPTVTLTNGFEPRWFDQTPRREVDHDLVFIGHPKPWHGADLLPQLLRDLNHDGIRASLLIIGGGKGADDLVADARHLGVADQITVTGALDPQTATGLLASARVGIAPYPKQENFYFCPLKVIDYLAAGLPIVSTDQGDIAALVGRAGIVVPAGDNRAIKTALARLLTDAELRTQLGRAGREQALNNHTWGHVAARTHRLLASLFAPAVPALAKP